MIMKTAALVAINFLVISLSAYLVSLSIGFGLSYFQCGAIVNIMLMCGCYPNGSIEEKAQERFLFCALNSIVCLICLGVDFFM